MNNKKHRQGLTMVELLITAFMVALIGLVVYSGLNNGIKAYKRVGEKMPQEDVVFFYDKFFRDVTDSFKLSGMPFRGNQTSFSCPTIIKDRTQYGDAGEGLGRCGYFFNESARQIQRSPET